MEEEYKPRGRGRPKKAPTKLCVRCNRVLPLTEFYVNRNWVEQRYRDAWCKDCVSRYCVDKDSLRLYCYENNRKWTDGLYDIAKRKSKYSLATNTDYINPKTSQKKKKEIAELAAVKQFFSLMNMTGFYGFVDNVNGEATEPPGAQTNDGIPEDKSFVPKVSPVKYNRKWRGHYTDEQIEMLEDIYAQYEEGFVLDNVSIRD